MHEQPNERHAEQNRQDWPGMRQQQAVADPRGQTGHTNRTKADPPPKLPEPTPRMRGEQKPENPAASHTDDPQTGRNREQPGAPAERAKIR